MTRRPEPPQCPVIGCTGKLVKIRQAFRAEELWDLQANGVWTWGPVSDGERPSARPEPCGRPVVFCNGPKPHKFDDLRVTDHREFLVLLRFLDATLSGPRPDFDFEPCEDETPEPAA
jgi:hypothetical protein